MGLDWQPEANRQRAVQLTQAALSRDPGQAFTWFNLGSSLTYLNRYEEAAAAFDKARKIGLPQRMLRYQFGPFVAAYQTHRQDDLLSLADYALQITPNAEEALVWKGWAYVLAGDRKSAAQYFQQALQAHPDYQEAVRGLEFILR